MNIYNFHSDGESLHGYPDLIKRYKMKQFSTVKAIKALGFEDAEKSVSDMMEYADDFEKAYGSYGDDMGGSYEIKEELMNLVNSVFVIDWDEDDAEEKESSIVNHFEQLFSFWSDL